MNPQGPSDPNDQGPSPLPPQGGQPGQPPPPQGGQQGQPPPPGGYGGYPPQGQQGPYGGYPPQGQQGPYGGYSPPQGQQGPYGGYPPGQQPPGQWPPNPYQQPGYQQPGYGYSYYPDNVNGGLILGFGIASLCCCGVIFGSVAIIMGINGVTAINAGRADPSQKSLAIAGIVCGALGVILTVVWLLTSGPAFTSGFIKGFNKGFNGSYSQHLNQQNGN